MPVYAQCLKWVGAILLFLAYAVAVYELTRSIDQYQLSINNLLGVIAIYYRAFYFIQAVVIVTYMFSWKWSLWALVGIYLVAAVIALLYGPFPPIAAATYVGFSLILMVSIFLERRFILPFKSTAVPIKQMTN